MNFRIHKHPKGYVVEHLVKKRYLLFFTRKRWTHLMSVNGIPSEPWYYSTEESAMGALIREIKWNCISNSNH